MHLRGGAEVSSGTMTNEQMMAECERLCPGIAFTKEDHAEYGKARETTRRIRSDCGSGSHRREPVAGEAV